MFAELGPATVNIHLRRGTRVALRQSRASILSGGLVDFLLPYGPLSRAVVSVVCGQVVTMSATNRGGLSRHPFDFYETPAYAIDLALDALGLGPDFTGYVVDAGSGNGHIAHRVALRCPRADVRGVELQPELIGRAKELRVPTIAWTESDWLSWESDGTPDLVIGNPPYRHAEAFIRKALALAGKKGRVAMLLRDGFMLPKARRALRKEFGLPDRFGLEKRPSFNGSGTDACDYSWHVWGPKQSGKWTVLTKP